MTAPTTLRALAAACDDCARFDRIIRSRSECASEQRNAMMCALPPGGWPDTAATLRTMADTVEALEADRNALRADLDKANELLATERDLIADLHAALKDSEAAGLATAEEADRRIDALRAEVARLRPLRALLEHCEAEGAVVSLSCVPDARLRWLLATGGDGISFRANGDLDAVITAACDRLGVPHG